MIHISVLYLFIYILYIISSRAVVGEVDEDLDKQDSEFMKSHITNTCIQLDNLKCNNNIDNDYIESKCVKRFWDVQFDTKSKMINLDKQNRIFIYTRNWVFAWRLSLTAKK